VPSPTELIAATAESYQRFRCHERRARDGLYSVPQQPSSWAMGQRRLPVAETTKQLGQGPHIAMSVHTELD
jgi:hypothetical protein